MTPSEALPAVLDKIDANLDQSLERLFDLLRIQSISTDLAYKDQCKAAAEFVAKDLSSIGFDTSVRPTEGHPIVVGKSNGAATATARRRMCCSTAITTCSRSIRSTCGRRRRSRRASRRCRTAAR